MRVRHLLSLLAAAGIALLAAGPVAAQPASPSPAPALTVAPATIVGCGSTMLEGAGYHPDEPVEITVATEPWSEPETAVGAPTAARPAAHPASAREAQRVHANPEGSFSLTLGLPEVGRATITALGTESGASVTAVATVVPPGCGGATVAEPYRGRLLSMVGAVIGGGALLAAVGTLLWRRHHRTGG